MKKSFKETLKSKGFYITLGVGLCALLAVGYTVNGMKNAEKRLSKLNETKQGLEKSNELSSNYETIDNSEKPSEDEKKNNDKTDILAEFDPGVEDYENEVNKGKTDNLDNQTKQQASNEESNNKKSNSESKKGTDKSEKDNKDDSVAVMGYDNIVKNLTFNQEIGLMWPVKGDILKDYSEDKLVYFQTLGQYKYNPAVFITAEEGTKVKCSYKGVVTDIRKDEEFGNIVEISIGDKYVLTYGQLKDINVAKGDVVEEGKVIATVASPTGYYTSEGTHLYFKVCENDSTVNPLLFLR